MSSVVLGSRRFTCADQQRFADLSGDTNPLHLDSVAARRTLYGEVVVHGVHSLLWALDCWAATFNTKCAWSRLKTDFKRHLRLGQLVSCRLVGVEDKHFTLRIEMDGDLVAQITGSYSNTVPDALELAGNLQPVACRDMTFDEMTTASGSLPLSLDKTSLQNQFPKLAQFFPASQIAEILATTRLVGMECPGLLSLYSGHDLTFHNRGGPAELAYQVTRSDRRFSMLWLSVNGPGVDGTITAFARPRPGAQASMAVVSGVVERGEFGGHRALIVGGSRGLGEITAKIIAAGGGDVRLTYHLGKEDAERVAGEIHAFGAHCECLSFDATNPADNAAFEIGSDWTPTHLYYFATPFILLEQTPGFSPERFHNYCRYYLDGFSRAVEAALKLGGDSLTIFYPSTIFLNQFQKHTTEYCAAKAAGELLCSHYERAFPKLRVHCPRLPRMKTDQTSRLVSLEAAEPLEVLLKEIRAMQPRPKRGDA